MPYDPITYLSLLHPQCYHLRVKDCYRWLVGPYRTGFPPAKYRTLSWAHSTNFECVDIIVICYFDAEKNSQLKEL